ncbi:MAG TPA: hypothetical protein VKB32_05050 [Actinomycetota bacterium]|jgi:hypothetical protein|nr:hypothetical protein [Actinomycetota bacterium]
MQEVRADGFDRLDPLETAHAEPTLGPLPLSQPESPHYPLAIVEWHDAWFDLDLESPDVCRQDYLVRTVGFLVGEGPRFVSLAQEILPDGEGLRAVTHIPLPIVERVILLERSAERFDRPAPPHLESG